MKIWRAAGMILFLLNSAVFADVFSFKADRMTGGKATGKDNTVLIGNAQVKSDNLIINADRIEISGKDNRFVDCTGKVIGIENEKQIFFKADKMNYDRQTKIAILEGNSSLEDKKNQVAARARRIKYNQNTEIAIFQVSVRLFKDNIACRSEYAVYRRNEKLLDLSGFPIVYKSEDEFQADKIRVDLDTDDVTMQGSVYGTIKQNDSGKTEENSDAATPAPESVLPEETAPPGDIGINESAMPPVEVQEEGAAELQGLEGTAE